ncbi:hypothetical protein [Enterococcus crotali]
MIIISFCAFIFLICARILSTRFPLVTEGISKKAALDKIATKSSEYYIVKPELWTTSRGWTIESENGHNLEDVELVDNSPKNQLSSMVLLNEDNNFLVKGTLIDKEKKIVVKSWKFITPIKRDYLHPKKGQKNRWFYPKKYVDQFDVDNGDYKP